MGSGLRLLGIALVVAACGNEAVDPGDVTVTLVDSSSARDGWAVNYPKQRKLFFMAGRLWVFYSDGVAAVARTTTDGGALSDPVVIREDAVFGHRVGYAFDGTYLHYAHCTALSGEDVHYRRGLPLDDGTIAWDVEEQIAFDVPGNKNAMYPKVVVDADGHPWVAFMLFEGGFEVPPEDAIVTRSSTTDGRFVTDDGFPFALVDDNVESFPDPVGVALASGGTLWLFNRDDERYRARLWDGGWRDEEPVSNDRHRYGLFNVVADGDEVHVAYGSDFVHHRRRSADGGWSAATTIGRGSGHTSLTRLGPGRVLVTWLGEDRVLGREVENGDLHPAVELIAPEAGLAGRDLGINLNALVESGGPFGVAVTTTSGDAPPYDVWLATRPAL